MAGTELEEGERLARLKRPSSMAPAMQELNAALHELHESAGLPSLSDLVRRIGKGVASRSRIHEAFVESRLPAWGLVELLVEELAGRVPGGPSALEERQRFHDLWRAASKEALSASHDSSKMASAVDALLLAIDWLIAPQPDDPLSNVIDLAMTEAGMDRLLIGRSEGPAFNLLVVRHGSRTGAHLFAALILRLDALFESFGVDLANHKDRVQLRVLAHTAIVDLDGQVYAGNGVSDLRAHQSSPLVQDLRKSANSIVAIAADAVAGLSIDRHSNGTHRFEWSSVLNSPDTASPLRLWIRKATLTAPVRAPLRSPMHADERLGVSLISRLIHEMGWLFVEQPVDRGVDAHIEIVTEEQELTGRLIALVIKSGRSFFQAASGNGWLIRLGRAEHASHLLGHTLPIVLVIVNPETQEAYWVHITKYNLTLRKSGWEVAVPKSQTLGSEAVAALRSIAEGRYH